MMGHPTVNELRTALAESLKLQSHYAKLLNMWDGGKRETFPTVESWLARLTETGTLTCVKAHRIRQE